MLDTLNLAIVDVETTGGSPAYSRIIEIGIRRVELGRPAASYSTLINPLCQIPPDIVAFTGITDDDVADAPTFDVVAQRVHELLQGCVFVAHNVRFDYGFVRNELERTGRVFAAPCLCTVRLSRLLYPGERHHNLDAVIERCSLSCARRHRALDDAEAVWDFLQHARQHVAAEELTGALTHLLAPPSLPPQIALGDIEALPDRPGVYLIYDASGALLYIGRSANIRDRVLAQLANEHSLGQALALRRQAARVEARPTFGELGAMLLERHLLRTRGPRCNRRAPSRSRAPRIVADRPLKRWPFPGPVLIDETDPERRAGHAFLIDQWRLRRALAYEGDAIQALLPASATFEHGLYKVLTRYFAKRARRARVLSPGEAAQWLDQQDTDEAFVDAA